jgi:hypothetical protein
MKGRESGGVKELVNEWICDFVSGKLGKGESECENLLRNE